MRRQYALERTDLIEGARRRLIQRAGLCGCLELQAAGRTERALVPRQTTQTGVAKTGPERARDARGGERGLLQRAADTCAHAHARAHT
jgi:hypothetical protein